MPGRVGVVINAFTAAEAVDRIAQAEAAGVPHAWMTTGGVGPDALTIFAAAAMRTERITLGTCIIPTWPRHPIAIAQQIVALESFASGRIRLGIGPSHEPSMTSMFGVQWRKPLTQLREYLQVLRALLHEGAVDFVGEHVVARAQLAQPPRTPLLASALRPAAFEACGELADGAISWQCPAAYLVEQALPALARGAARAGRAVPPLMAHVPVAITTDRAAVREAAGRQVAGYSSIPFYRAMYEQAGVPQEAGSVGDELIDALVVWGDEQQVVARLAELLRAGMGELLVMPLVTNRERDASIERVFHAAAAAARATA
ncbi:MAG: LLM class flavin-dependent oxidoreductase [Dehalococcoidia bacterium]|nr:LLM class flavin-dependent oxidoreductase [Dehalococcoidia bacterium]